MISYEGNEIRLRPITKLDIEKSIVWRNDPETRENSLGYRFPVTEQMENTWYDLALTDQNWKRVIYAIESTNDQVLIGFIQINRINWINRVAYFGITIGDKSFRGKNIAEESMNIFFNYVFNLLNIRKICLEVPSYNNVAIKLYRRFGFIEEGLLKDHIYLERNYFDIILMRIFDSEFFDKSKAMASYE
jgi:RimJ/RimL family protein N-acetyltransferase